MGQPDFAAEGLLDDLEGDARDARLKLLEQLHDEGISLGELKRAVAEHRLVLLPVERALGGEPRHTQEEIAQMTGLPLDFIQRQRAAVGITVPPPDARLLTDDDLEAARRLARFREAGMPEESMLGIARALGAAMYQVAATLGDTIGNAMLEPGIDEAELARRYALAASAMMPEVGPMLESVLRAHLLDLMSQYVMTAADREIGSIERADSVVVCFADIVGFTRLGEQLPPDQLSAVATALEERARELAQPPVRLVKTIGDAVMLVSREPEPMVDVALTLVEEHAGNLRAGIALGEAVSHRGDYFGRPVNLASRVCGRARPGSVLATAELHDALENHELAWSKAGFHRLKNVSEPQPLWRLRRSADDGDADDARP